MIFKSIKIQMNNKKFYIQILQYEKDIYKEST